MNFFSTKFLIFAVVKGVFLSFCLSLAQFNLLNPSKQPFFRN
jgi:hypothetical protein